MKVVLIPAYNEEDNIAKVILRCEEFCDEIIVCDDGSKDETANIAEKLGATVIRHGINKGKGVALKTLFLRALEMKADQVITLDGDGQHDPRDIPLLLEALKGADMVIGKRENIPLVHAVGNVLLSGFNKFDTQSGFRAYRGSVLRFLLPTETRMGVDTEIYLEAKHEGLRIIQVQISADYSVPSPSTHNFASHFLTVFFSKSKLILIDHPGFVYGIPGSIFLLLSIWFGIHSAQYLLTEGLGSVVLLIIAGYFLSTAVMIWTITTMRRQEK